IMTGTSILSPATRERSQTCPLALVGQFLDRRAGAHEVPVPVRAVDAPHGRPVFPRGCSRRVHRFRTRIRIVPFARETLRGVRGVAQWGVGGIEIAGFDSPD